MLLIEYDYFLQKYYKTTLRKKTNLQLKLHVMSLEETCCDELALLVPA